ncbi:hypothetical protein G167_gp45 [Burkholderia phage BcepMigl]|uniref:Uncharacterized protein n=1 Tax=Burkholderia phage BcepMigl TaxID=2886899 RepID=I6XKV0_9CAUD|nr:hypothetical protein G167_gp45 [Burkholderia phage BcepMigl]AFN39109.1 hypothetical protein BcepMigl_gp40 [Burkholderia phage BcepMigl]
MSGQLEIGEHETLLAEFDVKGQIKGTITELNMPDYYGGPAVALSQEEGDFFNREDGLKFEVDESVDASCVVLDPAAARKVVVILTAWLATQPT